VSTGAAIEVGPPWTDDLGAGARADVRALWAGVFAADWTEADRERRLGGVHALVAVSTTDAGAGRCAARGWRSWRGRTSVPTLRGTEPTGEDDDSVRVLPVTADLDRDGELSCDWRAGNPW
jgi:aminoglycoside 2'-N-acetyltransferase I